MAGLVTEFNDGNWQQEVVGSDVPVLVDFWAVWCGPCRALGPTVASIAADYEGKVKVGKLNIDDNGDTAAGCKISAVPTLLVYKGGKEVARLVGNQPKSKIADALNDNL